MPGRSRIHLDGVPLHIVQRCHNRERCFFSEDDYGSTGALSLDELPEQWAWAAGREAVPASALSGAGTRRHDRQAAYRVLLRVPLDRAVIHDIRLALNQGQPLGNERFYAKIWQILLRVRRWFLPQSRTRCENCGSATSS